MHLAERAVNRDDGPAVLRGHEDEPATALGRGALPSGRPDAPAPWAAERLGGLLLAKRIGSPVAGHVGAHVEEPLPVLVSAAEAPPISAVVLYGDVVNSRVTTQESPDALQVTFEATEHGGKDTVTEPRGVDTATTDEAVTKHADSSTFAVT